MKPQTQPFSEVVFLLVVITFLELSCSPPQQTIQRAPIDPFTEKKQKVLLDGISREHLLPVGAKLAVLIDEHCVTRRGTQLFLSDRSARKSSFLSTASSAQALPGASKRSAEQTVVVSIPRDMTLEELERIADSDSCVKGISFNRHATTDSSFESDPLAHQQTHLEFIHAVATMPIFFDPGSGIKKDLVIAIVDTGLDLTHPDLKEHLWVNTLEALGESGKDDDQNGFIDDIHGYNFPGKSGDPSHQIVNDHGTHVAGLAAAVASNGIGGMGVVGHRAKIMSLNVFGRNWSADTLDIDTAIRYAADNGAHIINVSVGGPGVSDTTGAAIAYAINKGSVIIASAGNLSQSIADDFYFPASYAARFPGMLAVASLDTQTGTLCETSNFGPGPVKIAAPGCDSHAPKKGLFSTKAGGGYGYRQGTSMAAPLVAGAAALAYGMLRERNGKLPTPSEVEDLLVRASPGHPLLQTATSAGRYLDLTSLASLSE